MGMRRISSPNLPFAQETYELAFLSFFLLLPTVLFQLTFNNDVTCNYFTKICIISHFDAMYMK
jgi:hypothetical protein